uniref:Putative secreted protein n=1 Tax=Lutzomyia longipalpis TaxID=7200 RepID=A0A1B0CUN2_LUTLO
MKTVFVLGILISGLLMTCGRSVKDRGINATIEMEPGSTMGAISSEGPEDYVTESTMKGNSQNKLIEKESLAQEPPEGNDAAKDDGATDGKNAEGENATEAVKETATENAAESATETTTKTVRKVLNDDSDSKDTPKDTPSTRNHAIKGSFLNLLNFVLIIASGCALLQ